PVRPNPIGTSIVRLEAVEGAVLLVLGLDCLDGTPLLDLKPDRTLFTPIAPPQPGDFETGLRLAYDRQSTATMTSEFLSASPTAVP
ncbi:TrmO family methyltransferase, partial [Rhizobium leguminosarum]|uniref:TrmO family methyltransferase domain-containing protein n=1 Tax=Rhizobium leguminosarum TaxID=384 RepID=UPI003F9CD547